MALTKLIFFNISILKQKELFLMFFFSLEVWAIPNGFTPFVLRDQFWWEVAILEIEHWLVGFKASSLPWPLYPMSLSEESFQFSAHEVFFTAFCINTWYFFLNTVHSHSGLSCFLLQLQSLSQEIHLERYFTFVKFYLIYCLC